MADAPQTILESIRTLMARRGASDLEVTAAARLVEDLGFDSLELAELSADLEDRLGRDPFSEGLLPATVAELTAFYDA